MDNIKIDSLNELGVSIEEYIRKVIKEEIAAQFERLNEKVELIEKDLILSKQQMTESVVVISQTLGTELEKLMNQQQEGLVTATVSLLQARLHNSE